LLLERAIEKIERRLSTVGTKAMARLKGMAFVLPGVGNEQRGKRPCTAWFPCEWWVKGWRIRRATRMTDSLPGPLMGSNGNQDTRNDQPGPTEARVQSRGMKLALSWAAVTKDERNGADGAMRDRLQPRMRLSKSLPTGWPSRTNRLRMCGTMRSRRSMPSILRSIFQDLLRAAG